MAERLPFRAQINRGMRRFHAGWFALLAATIISLYLCWLMLRPFVEVLLWAVVLVIVFYPVHRKIYARVQRPGASALISCLALVTLILVPLTMLAFVVVAEAGQAAKYLQDKKNYEELLHPDQNYMQFIGRFVDVEHLRSPEGMQEAISTLGSTIAGPTASIVGNVLVTILKTVFVVFTMYYLFRDGERLRETLRSMLPLDPSQSARIFARTREVINASLHGVMVIAGIQGIMGGFAFWVLGLPSPLLWGSIMTLLSTIPLVGSTVVWIPTVIFLLLKGFWIKAILLALWGGVAISSVDNFLRPRLVGGRTRLHELLVFFSVVGGLQVFGILGIVVGPVVVAITLALLDVFRKVDSPSAELVQPTLVEMQAKLRDVPPDELPPGAPVD